MVAGDEGPVRAAADALPYYDTDIDTIPDLRVEAERAVEQEKRHFTPHDSLPPAFEFGAQWAAELERAERGEKLQVLDTSRYQLPHPLDDATEDEWHAALINAEVQLRYMDGRLLNLELLRRYGRTYLLLTCAANVWRLHNYQQEGMAALQTRLLDEATHDMDELNRTRKAMHLQLGDKISMYESRWRDLVSRNLSIRVANLAMRAEIDDLTRRTDAARRTLAAMEEA